MRFTTRIAVAAVIAVGSLVPTLGVARAQDPPADEAVLLNAPLHGELISETGRPDWLAASGECAVWKGDGYSESVWAGKRFQCGYVNANGGSARFNGPTGLCYAPNNGVYVADTNNQVIRKVDAGRDVVTIVSARRALPAP